MKYTVYFEIYDKKMKTTVEASSAAEAKKYVRERLHIIDVRKEVEKKDERSVVQELFGWFKR